MKHSHPCGRNASSSFCWICKTNTCCDQTHPHIGVGTKLRVPKKTIGKSKWKKFVKHLSTVNPYYKNHLKELGINI